MRNFSNNLWYFHTLKFFVAIKMNKSALYALIWKCLQNVPLNKKKDAGCCGEGVTICVLVEA